jgi:hypothetical protein
MKGLKRLVVAFCLLSALAITAAAGEISTPPCPPPDPGEVQAPPCSTVQQSDNPTNPDDGEYQAILIDNIVSAAVGTLLSIW